MFCFVSGCPNGLGVTKDPRKARMVQIFFNAPQDSNLFRKWQEAIPKRDRAFSRTDKLCDYHFKKSEVVLFNETKLPNGNVKRVPASEPKLKAGTVPSVFPEIKETKVTPKRKLPLAQEYRLHEPNQPAKTYGGKRTPVVPPEKKQKIDLASERGGETELDEVTLKDLREVGEGTSDPTKPLRLEPIQTTRTLDKAPRKYPGKRGSLTLKTDLEKDKKELDTSSDCEIEHVGDPEQVLSDKVLSGESPAASGKKPSTSVTDDLDIEREMAKMLGEDCPASMPELPESTDPSTSSASGAATADKPSAVSEPSSKAEEEAPSAGAEAASSGETKVDGSLNVEEEGGKAASQKSSGSSPEEGITTVKSSSSLPADEVTESQGKEEETNEVTGSDKGTVHIEEQELVTAPDTVETSKEEVMMETEETGGVETGATATGGTSLPGGGLEVAGEEGGGELELELEEGSLPLAAEPVQVNRGKTSPQKKQSRKPSSEGEAASSYREEELYSDPDDPTWAPSREAAELSDGNDTDPDEPETRQRRKEKPRRKKLTLLETDPKLTLPTAKVPPEVTKILTQDTLQQILRTLKLPLDSPVTLSIADPTSPGSPTSSTSQSAAIYTRSKDPYRPFTVKSEKLMGVKMFEGLGKIKNCFRFSTFLNDVDDELQFKKFCLILKECLRDVNESKNAATNIGRLSLKITPTTKKTILPIPDLAPLTKKSNKNIPLKLKSSKSSSLVKLDSSKEKQQPQAEQMFETFECITVDSNVENHYETGPSVEELLEEQEELNA